MAAAFACGDRCHSFVQLGVGEQRIDVNRLLLAHPVKAGIELIHDRGAPVFLDDNDVVATLLQVEADAHGTDLADDAVKLATVPCLGDRLFAGARSAAIDDGGAETLELFEQTVDDVGVPCACDDRQATLDALGDEASGFLHHAHADHAAHCCQCLVVRLHCLLDLGR